MSAKELKANPRNWRVHPDEQKAAMRSILDEIGFAGTLVARETPDGLELLDGHLRADLADDATVPVAIVDLNDSEAAMVLATYDQLGEMALVDSDKLSVLLGVIDELPDENAEFRRLAADLHKRMAKEEKDKADPATEKFIPNMELQPYEHYDYLVVLATSTHEWNVICDRLALKPMKRRGRMGTCRAIRASQLLTVLNNAALPDRGAKPKADAQHADHPKPVADGDNLRGRKGGGGLRPVRSRRKAADTPAA